MYYPAHMRVGGSSLLGEIYVKSTRIQHEQKRV